MQGRDWRDGEHQRWLAAHEDTAARQAVEGIPCYMYGIRAPEDDELPAAPQPATDVPEDIRAAADKIGFAVIESGDYRHIADAILAERKRCAEILRDNHTILAGEPCEPNLEELLHSIETGQ